MASSNAKQKRASNKRDPIWTFFKEPLPEEDMTKVKCDICKILISRGGTGKKATNANMVKHLQRKHKSDYQSYILRKTEAITKSTAQPATQMKLKSSFAGDYFWKIDDPKSMKIHYAVGDMIAADNQPFSFVENDGFNRLMNMIQPRYKVPGRTYFTTNIIPHIYEKCKGKISEIVSKAHFISFTTDIWTAKHCNESFLSLTGHCISDDFEFKHFVLNSSHIPESHTGENISKKLILLLKEWKSSEKVHLVIRDNAAAMIKALEDVPNASCFLHTLQLAIEDSMKSQRAVIDTIGVSKNIVTHFNHSAVACTRLKEIQQSLKMKEHKLIQDVPTRWNSTFYLLQRLLEQKDPLILYASQGNIINLKENQWSIVKGILALLQPFEEITKIISESESIISEVIPTVATLTRYMQKDNPLHFGVGTMKDTLKASLISRFRSINSTEHYTKATFLDPRFKLNFFDPSEGLAVKQLVTEELVDSLMNVDSNAAAIDEKDNETTNTPAEELRQNIHSSFWDCYSEVAAENVPQIAKETSQSKMEIIMKNEITLYTSLAAIPKKDSPFLWWKHNQSNYPNLAKLAKKYLSAPASTVYSERLFSTQGIIYEDKRSKLLPANGEMLTFLNRNLPLLNFEY